jgi:ubiquinone/menaquinone biosynthesis C-methylase UbiE
MEVTFVHPITKRILEKDSQANLFCVENGDRCVYQNHHGCYDFAQENPNVRETRSVYDEFYAEERTSGLTLNAITATWFESTLSWRKTLLDSLGSLAGKRVLLLGNGASYREFYFLLLGARVVFTDLSFVAVMRAREAFWLSEFHHKYAGDIEFHAVDATRLPFPDQYFDVIYGTKVVGFVPDRSQLFSEVDRCLKSGGMCRFIDDAYSPAWNAVREVFVLPIKTRILWKRMSALERIRSGNCPRGSFGFKKEDFAPFLSQCRFTRLVFIREFFFLRVVQLVWGKMVHYDPKYLRLAKPVCLMMKWIDDRLRNTEWMHQNSLALVYGFDKSTNTEERSGNAPVQTSIRANTRFS